MFWHLSFIVILLCILHILFNCNAKARRIRKLPGPKESFLFGDILQIMRSSVDLMKLARELAEKSNGIHRLWTFPFGAVNIYNAQDVELILSNMKYHEKSEVYTIVKPWLGDGLLLSKGSKWRQRRKILTPTFHFNIQRQFGQVIDENAQRLVKTLEPRVGNPIDIVPVLSEFTLNSICETAMGTELSEETLAQSYKQAICDLGNIFYQRFSNIGYLFDCIFNISPLGRQQKKHLDVVHSFTKKVIKERKEHIDKHTIADNGDLNEDEEFYMHNKKKKTAMLDLLISAQKAGEIDEIGIQEEVDTFMFEGHDTTASALTFCFMLLANHELVQEKIVEELVGIYGDLKLPIKLEDLSKMKYLERCIKESLRLYPPVHFISRSLNENVILSNYEIPAGTFCHVHIFDLHRRPELFENPNKFDPDRFLPENSVGRHAYAYIPFSAGPRNCIGQKFAKMEMKLAVARVLCKYKLKPVTRPSDLQFIADLILRNNGAVEVTFLKR